GFEGATVDLQCELGSGVRDVVVQLPAVIAVAERLCSPAKPEPCAVAAIDPGAVTVLDANDLEIDFPVGGAGSPTTVVGTVSVQSSRMGLRWPGRLEEQLPELASFLAERDLKGNGIPKRSTLGWSALDTATVVICDHEQPASTRDLIALAEGLRDDSACGVPITIIGYHGEQYHSPHDCRYVELRGGKHEAEVAKALTRWISENAPQLVLAPATDFGREVAARLAAQLGVGLIGDAVELGFGQDGKVIAYKPVGSELQLAAVVSRSAIQIVTMKLGRGSRIGESSGILGSPQEVLTVPQTTRVTTLRTKTTEDLQELDNADIVLGVGQGVDPTDYALIYEYADRLGASIACTRKVADRGWMPRSRQIGVTGRSIAPAVYLGVATRGSFNHLVGLSGTGTILLINHDADAVANSEVDAVIVSDWKLALPRIVDVLVDQLQLHNDG
ncbi:MAG: FAD-binding protein, partial [Ferrimicrobium sp.]